MVRSHVLLQGHLCVAHPATVGTGEGLRLLHREGLSPVVQVWREEGAGQSLRKESCTTSCSVFIYDESDLERTEVSGAAGC